MLELLLHITEIMYNPVGANTGRQWIEVQNVGSSTIDLAGKTMRISDSHGNHLIKAAIGSTTLDAEQVAIISTDPDAFLKDWPTYTGTIVKSAFSLTGEGTTSIGELNGKELTVFSEAPYGASLGADEDGNSLQTTASSTYIPGKPTPGLVLAVPPAPIKPPTKPISTTTSSIHRGATTHSTQSVLNESIYGIGTTASAAPAVAGAAEALSSSIGALVASAWFSSFLLLLAFSGFSVILLIRYA